MILLIAGVRISLRSRCDDHTQRTTKRSVNGVGGISYESGQAHVVLDNTQIGRIAAEDGVTTMKSGPSTHVTAPPATMSSEQPPPMPRMQLKPEAPTTGHVDGAWWPRSRDLRMELPPLTAELAARLGQIERVTYNLNAWDPVAKRITTDHGVIRLDGFHSQQADTISAIGGQGGQRRLTLLVIPPETSPESAQHILASASRSDSTDAIQDMLAPKLAQRPPTPDTAQPYSTASATHSWEAEGGNLN